MIDTISIYSSVSLLRGSLGFLKPAKEKPWQGGPPAIKSTLSFNSCN